MIGADISPIQPSWVPPNHSFNIDDATKEWTFPPDLFDYIHIRWLCGTIKDWLSLYKELYRCTKPGGWIEHIDGDVNVICLDGTMPDDSALNQMGKDLDGSSKEDRTYIQHNQDRRYGECNQGSGL